MTEAERIIREARREELKLAAFGIALVLGSLAFTVYMAAGFVRHLPF